MIVESTQQSCSSAKYYQLYTVATILEHVFDCFHTIVNDETNPYHPPLAWLKRKPPKEELFLDLYRECSQISIQDLSPAVKTKLEKCSNELKRNITNRLKDGSSPFFVACKLGNFKLVEYLIEHCQADIEQKGRYEAPEDHRVHSVSPLWVAAVSGHIETVKLLIKHNANINSLTDSGSSTLRSVCYQCRDDEVRDHEEYSTDKFFEIVKLLIENGADLAKSNYSGGTCLINSIHNYELTSYIIERGAEVDATDHKSRTALHYAIMSGRLRVTELLISYGANPMLVTDYGDDALQLSCLHGQQTIFNFLIRKFQYSNQKLADAYKLMGSSILELHYDLAQVRSLWSQSIKIHSGIISTDHYNSLNECDIRRRSLVFGDIKEFSNILELQSLFADDFRIQSLLISERVLGYKHRETIQRLLYRGTYYINSLMPTKCISLWIYAFRLKLKNESIFQLESVFAAQAISKLFLDILNQDQPIKFRDIYDVLVILVDQLDECMVHLNQKPIFHVHQETFDLLLEIILNLLLNLEFSDKSSNLGGNDQLRDTLIKRLIEIDPRTSHGSTLVHLCMSSNLSYKTNTDCADARTPVANLVELFVKNDFYIESMNYDGRTILQMACLSSCIKLADKVYILKLLFSHGVHLDRKTPAPDQAELIRNNLKDAGINLKRHLKLSCLAAQELTKINYDRSLLTKELNNFVDMH